MWRDAGATESSAEGGEGPCDGVQCQFYGVCHVVDNSARCICRSQCDDDEEENRGAVCGTDGRTYRSACRLRLVACRQQSHVDVAYYEPCTGRSICAHFLELYAVVTTTMIRLRRPFDCLSKVVKVTVT